MRRTLYESDHEDFREAFRSFIEKEIVPHEPQWERDGIVPRELFTTAGANGFLGIDVPETYGGGGVPDFRFNAVIAEELMRSGAAAAGLGLTLHNDIVLPYLLAYCSEEQKQRWLPGVVDGSLILAIAMTEPGIGSDLASMSTTAIRDGDHYVVNGAKTFITNGINADLVIVAVKTDPSQKHKGMSLLVVERGMAGFERGRNLDKLGQHAQDTAELSFTDVRVPVANLLGPEEGQGFTQLVSNLPQERLSIGIAAVAAARTALGHTLDYVKERKAFGSPIGSFQNSKFVLAELDTEIDIAEHYVDDCVRALNAGELTAVDASKAKYWCTELQGRVVDRCLQLHGGYGYMTEYPIAKAYADARITRIYGGTTEIMKEVIGRGLGL
ncbi:MULTISPECIES: acyl-CoA dehydrogenase family protein [Pseudonocardia]|uniref:Acyl-[acyl-carrier-protein] dehydrogenase MbtN n=2 Tax=Pseudonocardia TaxID=1847 RepID=A0A1Y2N304_PSEAH|nr:MULTISPECIES: acyl-CoA dehydrogenase family protein [Pseudonocardia]OSY41856.1 Acyl-CoA dehydrogenase [Pseudonocardia autotrophica]TDN71092.1 alkylation response protein AidB-like acyl-CoA dehydrogenase [Pseudonocardia autotrophica]BBG01762.1 acyl-CoA dehydrogenase [Pseudonocardia autotrophica]GEC26289.1 acyl-CoA dehydrogenase [Pseudonocardia saturnea]